MHKRVELLSYRLNNSGSAMTYIYDPDTAGKIEKPVPVHILEHTAFGARRKYWSGVSYAARDRSLPAAHPFLRFRPGYRCA
jgi:hypothetical protein